MAKNDSNELLNVLISLSLEMVKYNLNNNLEELKNDIENYKYKKLQEKKQMEELQKHKHFLKVLHSKNMDNNYQYNSSQLMKNYENDDKNNYSRKKSCDMPKKNNQLKNMLVPCKEIDAEINFSPIKRTKRYDLRKSAILLPFVPNKELIDSNINKDTNLENNNSSYNNKSKSENKDDSDTFTINENDNDNDNDNDSDGSSSNKKSENGNKSISINNNLENRNIANSTKLLKTYIKKLSSKFDNKKVSFLVDDNINNKSYRSNNSRKNSILYEDLDSFKINTVYCHDMRTT